MNDRVFEEKGFRISIDKSAIDIDFVHDYLSNQSYWAKGVSREIVERSIRHSLCFAVYQQKKQIGFARVITDFATFAYLADVFIDKNYRKKGLSKWLVQTILKHENLQGLRRIMLVTSDAQSLYAQFGFENEENPDRIMAIKKTYIGA